MTHRAPTPAPDWPSLERTARRWLGRRAPAQLVDDLTQETLLRVHRTLPPAVQSAEAWTVRAAHSVLVDALRRGATTTTIPVDAEALSLLEPLTLGDPSDRPDAGLEAAADAALDRAIARCLQPALAALPAEQREAIRLVDEQGLTATEAAAREGISPPGLRARLQRGRERVRVTATQCCDFDVDARGRPMGLQPRGTGPCACGCGTEAPR